MSKRNDVEINITAEAKKATAEVAKFSKDFKRSFGEINAALQIAKVAYEAVGKAVSALAGQVSKAIELSNKQEEVELRVAGALKLHGDARNETFNQLKEFNSALQQRLGIGDEESLQLQGTLLLMGVHKSELRQATEATIGLSKATGQGLNEAGKIIAKVFGGNTAALREYGIVVDSVEEAQVKLNEMFTVAGAQAGTFATQTNVLSANLGDAYEVLGKLVKESMTLSPVWADLNAIVQKFSDLFKDAEFKSAVHDIFAGIQASVRMLNNAMDRNIVLIKTATQLAGWFGRGLASNTITVEELPLSPEEQAMVGGAQQNALAQGKLGASVKQPKPKAAGGGGAGPKAPWFVGRDLTQEWQDEQDFKALEAAMKADLKMADYKDKLKAQYKDAMAIRKQHEKEFLATERAFAREQHNEMIVENQAAQAALFDAMASAGAGAFAGMVQSIASGTQSVGRAIAGFIGTIITQLGMFLIQIGIAGQAAAALSWLFPAAAGGFVAGAIAIAAGTAMVAAGTAISAAAGGSAPSRPSTAPQTVANTPTSAVRPEVASPVGVMSQASSPVNVTVNFNGVVTNPRRTAREIQGILATAV